MGTYIDPRPAPACRTSSRAMANRDPMIPVHQLREPIKRVYPKPEVRDYDADADCWVAPPPREFDDPRPAPRRYAPWPRTRGRRIFRVFDATTGARLGVLAANDISDAITDAEAWAMRSGFTAADVWVSR
jgi:hypothetical protein